MCECVWRGAVRSATRLSCCLSVCITVQRSFFLMGSTASDSPEIQSIVPTDDAVCYIIAYKKKKRPHLDLVLFCNNDKNITTIVFFSGSGMNQ